MSKSAGRMQTFARNSYTWLLVALFLSCKPARHEIPQRDWPVYRGDDGVNAFSSLDQITRENVRDLQAAWTYRTGDTLGNSSIQCNPLVIDGVLYGISPRMKVFALDAADGKAKWQYDPFSANPRETGVSRGLAFWKNDSASRIFVCAAHKLIALDAVTGKQVMNFGDSGFVDMRKGLRNDADIDRYYIRNTSPGVVYKDLIIIGSSLGETYLGLPGSIRAYDVVTGKLRWQFNTIPRPGDFGYDTWPKDAYTYASGCNVWGGMSIDKKRGMLFAATGAPAFDFHGGDRKGNNLFANCVLALDAETGKYMWHFQVSHHDLWDYDLPAPPNLVTLKKDGKDVDAVVQITKQGFVFVLDRLNGKPLFPVSEKNVPQSWMEDEETSSTQPFPEFPALVRQKFDTSDITDVTPESHAYVTAIVDQYDLGEIYTPPGLKGIIQLPGFRGGGEWSGAAIDKRTNMMYVGVNEIPNIVQLVELDNQNEMREGIQLAKAGEMIFQRNCSPCHGADRKGNGPFPSLLGIARRMKPEQAKEIISKGRSNMPAFAEFNDQQKSALVSFLFELKTDARFSGSLTGDISQPPSAKKYKIKGYTQLKDQFGYPGIKPPWGQIKAVDLNSGKITWSRTLGDYPDLEKKGLGGKGTQLFGGGIVTAGDVVFIGASQDEKFRAIDAKTGKTLWEYQLPAGGYATPATYEVNGRQFVVIAAGGGGFQATKSGDYYIAFALPEKSKTP